MRGLTGGGKGSKEGATNCVLHSTESVDRTPRRTHIFLSLVSLRGVSRTCSQLFCTCEHIFHTYMRLAQVMTVTRLRRVAFAPLAPKSLICTPWFH